MQLGTRKLIDRAFSGVGVMSILFMVAALLVILVPILVRGSQAFVFRGTIEYRLAMAEKFDRGDLDKIRQEYDQAQEARAPIYRAMDDYQVEIQEQEASLVSRKKELRAQRRAIRKNDELTDPQREEQTAALEKQLESLDAEQEKISQQTADFQQVVEAVHHWLGPAPGVPTPPLWRDQYGSLRQEQSEKAMQQVLYAERWVPGEGTKDLHQEFFPRVVQFKGTALEPMFPYIETHVDAIMMPRWTFYWQFLTDTASDAHFFGGIWAEILGTIYLTLGAIFFAVPTGVISAIYLVEYSNDGVMVRILRTFVNTLAGVPSIVFGLFGLAFFINTIHVSPSKSVLAGALTLALLILPMVIRASEEAIRSVPKTYKEAALSLGAGKWRTILTVVLPASLPGILTGIVISMGRAAGETAPIIFTAAVSVGAPLTLWETLSQPTPALPWNIYNLCTEHEAIDQIRHVQYGMVLTLIGIVLLLNVTAIVMRARISKKLRS